MYEESKSKVCCNEERNLRRINGNVHTFFHFYEKILPWLGVYGHNDDNAPILLLLFKQRSTLMKMHTVIAFSPFLSS